MWTNVLEYHVASLSSNVLIHVQLPLHGQFQKLSIAHVFDYIYIANFNHKMPILLPNVPCWCAWFPGKYTLIYWQGNENLQNYFYINTHTCIIISTFNIHSIPFFAYHTFVYVHRLLIIMLLYDCGSFYHCFASIFVGSNKRSSTFRGSILTECGGPKAWYEILRDIALLRNLTRLNPTKFAYVWYYSQGGTRGVLCIKTKRNFTDIRYKNNVQIF